MKKCRLLPLLAFFLTSFAPEPTYAGMEVDTFLGKGTLGRIATFFTLSSICMYQGEAALSPPTVKTLGGVENDVWYGIERTQDQGVLTVGESASYGIGLYTKGVMAQYDDLGNLVQYTSFGGARSDSIRDVSIFNDLYVMTGETTSFGDSNKDIFITVYDSSSSSWVLRQVMGSSGEDGGVAVTTHADGSYLVGGYTYQYGRADIVLTRFHANHSQAWSRLLDGGGDDHVASIVGVPNGDVVVGHTTSSGGGDKDVLVLNIDDLGSVAWAKALGSLGQEEGYDIVATSSGEILLTGYIERMGSGREDVLWVKLNRTTGELLSAEAIDLGGTEIGYGILSDDGYAFVTGSMRGDGLDDKDMFVLQLSDEGPEGAFALGSTSHDIGYDLTLQGPHALAVIGATFTEHGGQDALFAQLPLNQTACRMELAPTTTNITSSLSLTPLTLQNNLSNLAQQAVTWQTYQLTLEEETICTPTSAPTSSPTADDRPKVKAGSLGPVNIEVGDSFVFSVGGVFEGTFTLTATQKGKNTLPGWLDFNATSSLFQGHPTDKHIGSYAIQLKATNAHGSSTSFFFNINVRDPLADPGVQEADYLKIFAPLAAALLGLTCGAFICKQQSSQRKLLLIGHHKKTDDPNAVEFEHFEYDAGTTKAV